MHPLWEILGGDLIGGVLGLPKNLDYMPVLAVVDGLDGVDAASERLAGERSGVGTPEMGDLAKGFRLIFDLMLGDDFVAVFGNGGNPVVDGENVWAVGADGDEAHVGKEDLAETGTVLVGGAGDGVVQSDDELVEGGGGWAGCRSRVLGWSLSVRGRMDRNQEQEASGGYDRKGEAAHGGSVVHAGREGALGAR